ncbi:hypothetical protein RFI_12132 [Reticulomyxa filosa]|uniref:DUF1152 domain-containing protein n=1 Tax=Reticulomyxa filosa TaxID=46433 RepID=X6NH14_RETFI|nr:hypothetical protein RFI_12132 [Reticulomyxa filosa]|eukprot:ETO25014.1 hypothetical protein RFI_12132 [Reticulomyxa filosa]
MTQTDNTEEELTKLLTDEKNKFEWSSHVPWKQYKSVLVIGMGGGCDVFSAYAMKNILSSSFPSIKFFFGNCIGLRDLSKHKKLTECLYQVQVHSEISPNENYYTTTILEESLYKNPNSDSKEDDKERFFEGPYLLLVKHKKLNAKEDKLSTIEKVTAENTKGLLEAWSHLKVDLIISIDNGGDSLTGGIDYVEHVELGRDKQVKYALESQTNIDYLYVVMGPGCDGESEKSSLSKGLLDNIQSFLGYFMLTESLVSQLRSCAKFLPPQRTPNIIFDAYNKFQNQDKKTILLDDLIQIDRGVKPFIPLRWLISAWVFSKCKIFAKGTNS